MKKLFLLLILVLSAATMFADDVTLEQALQTARQFAKHEAAKQPQARRALATSNPQLVYSEKSKIVGKDNVYVINFGNDQGFVLVSGESGTSDEILGYCDHGAFEYEKAPVQLKGLLKNYSAGIDSLRQNPSLFKMNLRRATIDIGTIVIGPLLTTTWNQIAPYSNYCPEGCPTGCYPTALAQVMNYWKWPKTTHGKVDDNDFSGRTYDWDNMLDNYDANYTAKQADAVAKLMADIGTAFRTAYAPGGSPTPFSSEALIKNFQYEDGITTETARLALLLADKIKAELGQKRPVLYCGAPVVGESHALVCDGYTTNDYFHFNYGWGGISDGFYKLSAINYVWDAYMFVGVRPYDAIIKVIDGIEYGMLKNGTAEVLDYPEGEMGRENGELIIPATVKDDAGNDYKVTRIKTNAFYNKGRFTKVVIGDNVEIIEPFTFIYSKIDEVVLCDRVKEVPDEAFQTANIKKLTIGASVKRIGKKAFYLCPITEVVCKSPAFEVDDYAFAQPAGSPDCGDWLAHITKLGREAFAMCNFKSTPNFAMLEEIGSQAFASCTFPNETFIVPPKLKSIEPDAFRGAILSFFKVENNPHFLCSPYTQEYLCNSNGTSVLMTVNRRRFLSEIPETVVKLEPRSIRTKDAPDIPGHILEMDGAFQDLTSLSPNLLYCLAVVPPKISDDTFNDQIFEDDPALYVPVGTEELYRNAPGWRRFNRIFAEEEYMPMPPQGLQYNMVVSAADENGSQRVNIPVNEIKSIEVSEDGKQVIIRRSGKEDLVTSVAAVDSIEWAPGFVYENAEIFDLDENNLTVEAQKCKVRFDPTVIDSDVQLCVRNSVLKPNVMEGITHGFSIDLSMSDGRHELNGTAKITIPVTLAENEKVYAAYYNKEAGEWEPVFFTFDELAGNITITTNHLSDYGIFFLLGEGGLLETLNFYYGQKIDLNKTLDEAAQKLLALVSSDDPNVKMVMDVKNDIGIWQSIGLDGLWGMVNAVGDPLYFRPTVINDIVQNIGYFNMALNILDVAIAYIKDDNTGVAAGTLSTILNYVSGSLATQIGTPIMSASMATVAFIGVALQKFGTKAQERTHDMARDAYHYFYSSKGKKDDDVKSCYRSPADWYEYFLPAFAKGNMTKNRLDAYIEQSVRLYLSRIWDNEFNLAWSECCHKTNFWTLFSSVPDVQPSLQKQLEDEYFAELMNGELVSVFEAIRENLKTVAFNRYYKSLKDVADQVNTRVYIKIIDSSCKEGNISKYAGWTVRFTDAPDDMKYSKYVISDEGTASMGCTVYSLLHYNLRPHITLADLEEADQKAFDFKITAVGSKLFVTIDLASGGVEVEAPKLKNLKLSYVPYKIETEYECYGTHPFDRKYMLLSTPGAFIEMDGGMNRKARFQTELEKFFQRHNFITVQENSGIFTIGDDIVGKFENNGLEASGKFTIKTTHQFTEKTIEDFVNIMNKAEDPSNSYYWFYNLLGGTISHKIDCEYKITRKKNIEEYEITYTGSGTWQINADIVDRVDNWDMDAFQANTIQHITTADITTRKLEREGDITLEYSTKITP